MIFYIGLATCFIQVFSMPQLRTPIRLSSFAPPAPLSEPYPKFQSIACTDCNGQRKDAINWQRPIRALFLGRSGRNRRQSRVVGSWLSGNPGQLPFQDRKEFWLVYPIAHTKKNIKNSINNFDYL